MEIDLGDGKTYWKLVIGALGAGFVQGTLGVGAGTFLMAVLLASPLHPRVAAATSGYQLLFTGSAALVQQFINNKITTQDAVFYFSWSAIGGGIVTYILYKFIKRADEKIVKKILLWIITMLCVSSLILILPVTIQRLIE